MARARARILVAGRVQGVFFRQSTADEGARLGLDGSAARKSSRVCSRWRNLPCTGACS